MSDDKALVKLLGEEWGPPTERGHYWLFDPESTDIDGTYHEHLVYVGMGSALPDSQGRVWFNGIADDEWLSDCLQRGCLFRPLLEQKPPCPRHKGWSS